VPKIRLGKRTFDLPRSRVARIAIGVALIAGGLLGFLPVLGFWMIPAGLLVLSYDIPAIRRLRRRVMVAASNLFTKRRRPKSRSAQ
jgi:hypothetical protein